MTTSPPDSKTQSVQIGKPAPELKRRSRGRPSSMEAAELREAFLEVATQSFLGKGYAATSIEAIARDSGVAKITIYRQFGDKQSLFREVVRRAVERARSGMQAAFAGHGLTTRERLLQMIEGIYMGAVEPRTLSLMRLAIAEATRFPELSAMVYAETVETLDPLVHFLKQAHRSGELHVPCPGRAAILISALSFGGIRFLMSEPLKDSRDRREWAEGILEVVLQGLSVRSPLQ